MNDEERQKLRKLLHVLDHADALAAELIAVGVALGDARGGIASVMLAVSRVLPEDLIEEFDEIFAGATK